MGANSIFHRIAYLEIDNKALRALVKELTDQKMVLEAALQTSHNVHRILGNPLPAKTIASSMLVAHELGEFDETPPPKRRTRVKSA